MGSPCRILFYDTSEPVAQQKLTILKQQIDRLEDRYSRYRSGNLMAAINKAADSGGCITVDDEVIALLQYADACYQQSDGLFDITSGVLRELWDFSQPDNMKLPSQDQTLQVLERVGWRYVTIDGQQLCFSRPGMALDFGGIVKEYAADLAASQLQGLGVISGIVELGGDIRAIGPRIDGKPWTIKVRDPRKPQHHVREIQLYSEGLATSGDYERCVMIGGRRYSHLLSPRTGWPVAGLASVTVTAPQCIVAGSAATIAMLKGSEGRAWLESQGFEFFAIDAESA